MTVPYLLIVAAVLITAVNVWLTITNIRINRSNRRALTAIQAYNAARANFRESDK